MEEKAKGGRKPFIPTEEQRKMVEEMSAVGVDQAAIAKVLGICIHTLTKNFREELDEAATRANTKVAGNLFRQATKDDPKSVTAAIFWLKTRMGWRESAQAIDLNAKVENNHTIDVAGWSIERRNALKELLVDESDSD